MIAETIAFMIRNLPAVLLALALILGALGHPRGPAPARFLGWILLLPIGVTGLWAGVAHILFPRVATSHIGWGTSPFQFELQLASPSGDRGISGLPRPAPLSLLAW